jgi:hypothetical protein
MQALKGLVFGADFPYSTIVDHAHALRDCGFSDAELAGIDRGSVVRILPRYACAA